MRIFPFLLLVRQSILINYFSNMSFLNAEKQRTSFRGNAHRPFIVKKTCESTKDMKVISDKILAFDAKYL